jgi:hypothetical protein
MLMSSHWMTNAAIVCGSFRHAVQLVLYRKTVRALGHINSDSFRRTAELFGGRRFSPSARFAVKETQLRIAKSHFAGETSFRVYSQDMVLGSTNKAV